jgi:FdhE protein
MSSSSPVKFLSPEEIATHQMADAARLKFAELAFVFKDRELRLRQLAAGHSMRDYLIFMADVAQAQHAALAQARTTKLPAQEFLDEAAGAGVPPLEFSRWAYGSEWQEDLRSLLTTLLANVPQGPSREVLEGLQRASAEHLNQQAERLLAGIMLGLDFAAAPLIGAALQVYWTRLVRRTQAAYQDQAFGPIDNARVCPCCGSQPVASVLRLGGTDGTSRYLHCSLCQTEWHMVRIKCTHCEGTKGITYQELESASGAALPATMAPKGAVRAECCDACGHYLKIVSMEKDPHVDPVADDLATVALDLLVSETGKLHHGINYMLLWGEPADESHAPEPTHAGVP